MQFITEPVTLPGPPSDGWKREGRPLSSKEGRKKEPFWEWAQKGRSECGGCQGLGIHDWVFFVLIGSGSCLKRRSRGKFAWSDRLQMSVLESLKVCSLLSCTPERKAPYSRLFFTHSITRAQEDQTLLKELPLKIFWDVFGLLNTMWDFKLYIHVFLLMCILIHTIHCFLFIFKRYMIPFALFGFEWFSTLCVWRMSCVDSPTLIEGLEHRSQLTFVLHKHTHTEINTRLLYGGLSKHNLFRFGVNTWLVVICHHDIPLKPHISKWFVILILCHQVFL